MAFQADEDVLTAEIALPVLGGMVPSPSEDALDRIFEILRLVAGRAMEPQLVAGREVLENAMRFWSLRDSAIHGVGRGKLPDSKSTSESALP